MRGWGVHAFILPLCSQHSRDRLQLHNPKYRSAERDTAVSHEGLVSEGEGEDYWKLIISQSYNEQKEAFYYS